MVTSSGTPNKKALWDVWVAYREWCVLNPVPDPPAAEAASPQIPLRGYLGGEQKEVKNGKKQKRKVAGAGGGGRVEREAKVAARGSDAAGGRGAVAARSRRDHRGK